MSVIPEIVILESSNEADPLQAEELFGRVFISDSENTYCNY